MNILQNHEDLDSCLVRQAYMKSTATEELGGSRRFLRRINDEFVGEGGRIKDLFAKLAMSEATTRAFLPEGTNLGFDVGEGE